MEMALYKNTEKVNSLNKMWIFKKLKSLLAHISAI